MPSLLSRFVFSMPSVRRSTRAQYVQQAKAISTTHPGDNLYPCATCLNYDDRPGTKMPTVCARWTRQRWNRSLAYMDRHPTLPEGLLFPPNLLHAAITIATRVGITTIINPVAYEQLRVSPPRSSVPDQEDGLPVFARSILESIGREAPAVPFPQPGPIHGYPHHPQPQPPGNIHSVISAAQSANQQYNVFQQQHSLSPQDQQLIAAQNRPQQPLWAPGPQGMLYPWNGGLHGGPPFWWSPGSVPAPPQAIEGEQQGVPEVGIPANVQGSLRHEQGQHSRLCILSPRTSPRPMDLTSQETMDTNNPQAGHQPSSSSAPAGVMHSVQPPPSSLISTDIHDQGEPAQGSGEVLKPQSRTHTGPQCPPARTSNASDFPRLVK